MKKIVVAVILLAGAFFWAKKRFVDPPAQEVQSETEATAEKIGGLLAAQKKGQSTPKSAEGLSAMLASLVGGNKDTPEAKAKARVMTFMAAWKEGGTSLNDAAQAAACLWSRGIRFIPDKDEIQDAANGFDRWRHANNLYVEITTYSVGDVAYRANDPGRGDYSVIDVSINGQPYRIGVPDRPNPLFWLQ